MNWLAITSIVFTFILRLRFPRHTSFSVLLTKRYGTSCVKIYRNLENAYFRYHKTKLDLEFLSKCKSYNILPKFLYFKVHNPYVKTSKTYRSCQFKLLNLEIHTKNVTLKKQLTDYETACTTFKNTVSYLDFTCTFNRLKQSADNKLKAIKATHSKKLKALGIPTNNSTDTDKVVINLSNRTLTTSELDVLSLGLSFCIPKLKIDFISHYFSFETLTKSLKSLPLPTSQWNKLVKEISSIAHTSFRDFDSVKRSFIKLPQPLFDALTSLKADNSIVITKPDKGRGTVVMNKQDYITKVEDILNDATKFKTIKDSAFSYITKLEDKLSRLLRKLLKLKVITDDVFNKLFTSGSSPGILYGLPKTHKPDVPIRPIISTIGTFNYKLAKFFVPLLEPLTHNRYTIKNSYSFVEEMRALDVSDMIMASFDVKSLFTNIPLDETINIVCDSMFKDQDTYCNFTKEQFTSLLQLAVKDSPFIFNKRLYVQTDGVAMGSCLGPSLANIFLGYHECNWLDNCPTTFKPLLYRRYVDDSFLFFRNPQHIPHFLGPLRASALATSHSETGQ